MKSVYEFVWDGDVVELRDRVNLRKAYLDGHRIVWNHKGMRGVIPPATLEAAFDLIDAYESRLRQYDMVPEGVGLIGWESVVLVPSPARPTGPRTSEDA